MRHSLHFYREYCGPSADSSASRWMAGHLLTHPEKSQLSLRDVGQAKDTLRDGRQARAAMRGLEFAGWVAVLKTSSEGPSHWRVNPTIHERFSDRAEREAREWKLRQQEIRRSIEAREAIRSDGEAEA
jgi:hypothetical protein